MDRQVFHYKAYILKGEEYWI